MKKQKKINQLFDSMEVAEYFHTFFDINNFDNILKNGLKLKNNFDFNAKAYCQFNNCSLKHFFVLIHTSPLSKMVEEDFNKKYGLKISFSLIAHYIENDYLCNNSCSAWLKQLMEYMHNNPQATEKHCGFGNYEVKPLNKLYQYNDSVGMITKISSQLDFNTRDNGWIYIHQNILLKTDKHESHTHCLIRWCKKNHMDFSSDKKLVRLNEKELNDININACSFGHILNNNAFIETMQNVSLNEVKECLTRNGLNKIYLYNQKNRLIKRIV